MPELHAEHFVKEPSKTVINLLWYYAARTFVVFRLRPNSPGPLMDYTGHGIRHADGIGN